VFEDQNHRKSKPSSAIFRMFKPNKPQSYSINSFKNQAQAAMRPSKKNRRKDD
jgi:hypothetical protein